MMTCTIEAVGRVGVGEGWVGVGEEVEGGKGHNYLATVVHRWSNGALVGRIGGVVWSGVHTVAVCQSSTCRLDWTVGGCSCSPVDRDGGRCGAISAAFFGYII